MKTKNKIRLISSTSLIVLMWMDFKWALYLNITLLCIGMELFSYYFEEIFKS